jgi:hypothetical protein
MALAYMVGAFASTQSKGIARLVNITMNTRLSFLHALRTTTVFNMEYRYLWPRSDNTTKLERPSRAAEEDSATIGSGLTGAQW